MLAWFRLGFAAWGLTVQSWQEVIVITIIMMLILSIMTIITIIVITIISFFNVKNPFPGCTSRVPVGAIVIKSDFQNGFR